MAGTIVPVHHCQESLPIREICATHRTCPGRDRWRPSDRSFARPAKSFLGRPPAIGTCPGKHGKVHCYATALRPSCNCFPLGKSNLQIEPGYTAVNTRPYRRLRRTSHNGSGKLTHRRKHARRTVEMWEQHVQVLLSKRPAAQLECFRRRQPRHGFCVCEWPGTLLYGFRSPWSMIDGTLRFQLEALSH